MILLLRRHQPASGFFPPLQFSAMVNYYDILKVSQDSSAAEIKSAYRKLARKYHPDVSQTGDESNENFAQIAKAYEVLSNKKARAVFDKQLAARDSASVLESENAHAQKLRQMQLEIKYNRIVDSMIEAERNETLALQKAIFPMVGLFVSTCCVAIFRPAFWSNSEVIGKIVLGTLFVIGVLHLFKRLKAGYERFTYDPKLVHESILGEDDEPPAKPVSRFGAVAFFVGGMALSLGLGILIGDYLHSFVDMMIPTVYSQSLKPEFIVYPPIVVLLVDLMHSLVVKIEN